MSTVSVAFNTGIAEKPSSEDSYKLVHEQIYHGASLMAVIQHLRSARSTGTLFIDLSQGGIGKIRFREQQDIMYEPK